jgi:hypothetical protein
MTEEQKKNYLYILFIVVVIVLALIYFSVPERAKFFENQILWWKEFNETFLGFLR